MNTQLLRRVQKAILKHPDQFNMTWWFQGVSQKGKKPSRCGTAACIAGWALTLERDPKGQSPSRVDPSFTLSDASISDSAQKLLKLNDSQSYRLFGAAKWPRKFLQQFREAKSDRGAARIAAKRIDHFIKTKGAE